MTTEQVDRGYDELVAHVRQTRGFDFASYKPSTVERRITKRMGDLGIEDHARYLDHLQVHPDEFAELFNAFLINVTGFFRDAEHWEHLRAEVIPEIIRRSDGGRIRTWSAGCSSGPEAYTIAMLFAEALGAAACRDRVKVYATDLDEHALAQARQATYSAHEVEAVPEALRATHFAQRGDRYAINGDLRRSVIFGRHDLLRDAPIGRLDLLVCRNVLMYFTADSQARILRHLHFALEDDGYLFLGRAETMLSRSDLFAVVDLRHRVFKRAHVTGDGTRPGAHPAAGRRARARPDRWARLRDAAIDAGPVAQVIIDADGVVVLANAAARTMFELAPSTIGQQLSDLGLSYRPVELRSRIETALASGHTVQVNDAEHRSSPTEVADLDVRVTPLTAAGGGALGVAVTFEDVTRYGRLRRRLQESNQELETAYEELQSTNEELETTNEELQSTVEELETTNEELQSTNEELETMNEELQAANAEQQDTNHTLRERSAELDHRNAFLQSVLGSLSSAVVVIDRDHTVIGWNAAAETLWGLRADEVVGHALFELEFGLPVARLAEPVRGVFAEGGRAALDLKAVTRLGRQVVCHTVCAPLHDAQGTTQGSILTMEVAS